MLGGPGIQARPGEFRTVVQNQDLRQERGFSLFSVLVLLRLGEAS